MYLKNNKTGGSDGFVGALPKYGGSGMVSLLEQLQYASKNVSKIVQYNTFRFTKECTIWNGNIAQWRFSLFHLVWFGLVSFCSAISIDTSILSYMYCKSQDNHSKRMKAVTSYAKLLMSKSSAIPASKGSLICCVGPKTDGK